MTHPVSTTSCFKRFKSKMVSTVGLWPARLAMSLQVRFVTKELSDLSNFKMWSCTFAPTIACAPSNQCAIGTNVRMASKTILWFWSLIHIKWESVLKRIYIKLTLGESQVVHSPSSPGWVVWCTCTLPGYSIASMMNTALQGLVTQAFPRCNGKQVNPPLLAHHPWIYKLCCWCAAQWQPLSPTRQSPT
jgi:hypothetical protein